jgi:hypothetical protein
LFFGGGLLVPFSFCWCDSLYILFILCIMYTYIRCYFCRWLSLCLRACLYQRGGTCTADTLLASLPSSNSMHIYAYTHACIHNIFANKNSGKREVIFHFTDRHCCWYSWLCADISYLPWSSIRKFNGHFLDGGVLV